MHQNVLTTPRQLPAGRLRVALGQFQSKPDVEQNIETIKQFASRASGRADLLVLPEAAMYAWNSSPETISKVAVERSTDFLSALAQIARESSLAVVAGLYTPGPGQDARPMNRQVAISPSGELLAEYDKVHLYDAFGYRESDTVQPGPIYGDFSELAVIEVAGWKVGLFNCYDLRFPEIARGLIDRGADVLALSSAWVRGEYKEEHWDTLIRARAIENTAFVVAANQGGDFSTGNSIGVDPFGRTIGELGETDDLSVVELDPRVLEECRLTLPSLENRRYATSATPRN